MPFLSCSIYPHSIETLILFSPIERFLSRLNSSEGSRKICWILELAIDDKGFIDFFEWVNGMDGRLKNARQLQEAVERRRRSRGRRDELGASAFLPFKSGALRIMRPDSKIVMVIGHIIAALESLTFQLCDRLFSSLARACLKLYWVARNDMSGFSWCSWKMMMNMINEDERDKEKQHSSKRKFAQGHYFRIVAVFCAR